MLENQEVYTKITNVLTNKGPSLPMQIAKEVGMSSLFISAFLSEMLQERRVKMSHLKVGGSRLYLLQNQDELLENFYRFLNPKEIDAFLKLKEKKFLKESEQDPAMKVALRSIEDFAKSFTFNNEIYWRYVSISEQEIREQIQNQNRVQIERPAQKEEPEINVKKEVSEAKKKFSNEPAQKIQQNFNNPLVKETPTEIEKPKPEFVQRVIEFIQNNNYKLLEEKEIKKKEFLCILQIETELGPTNYLTSAKDKKSIAESDVQKLLATAQSIPLPALILYTETISKNAQKYIDNYFSILKAKKIE